MNIRKATLQDINQIESLYSEQFDVMADLLSYLNKPGSQDRQFIEDSIVSDDSEIFIAENNTDVVGFILVFERESPDFNFRVKHKYSYIMDIIVTKEYRKKGIASKLMNTVIQWSKKRNLDYIELSVLANNSAVDFYRKLHFEETVKTMIHKL